MTTELPNTFIEKPNGTYVEGNRLRWSKLKRVLTIGLLATTFSGQLEAVYAKGNQPAETSDHQKNPDQLSEAEITQIAPFAKIPIYTDLGDGTFEMGHAGLGIETSIHDGVHSQHILLCTVSHVVFPYDLRDQFFQPDPKKKNAETYFSQTDKFSRTGLNSSSSLDEANFLISNSLAMDMGNPNHSLRENPYEDHPICFSVDPEILRTFSKKYNPEVTKLPEINVNPTFTKGETEFAFDRNLRPQYYIVNSESEDEVMLKPTSLGAELALVRGDSGSPLYRKKPDGTIEMVGTYLGQNILPSANGGNISFILDKFFSKKELNNPPF